MIGLIHSSDVEVLTDALWALAYLSGGENVLGLVDDPALLSHIVGLLLHHLPLVQRPAITVIGNLCQGPDEQTQAALDAGALSPLRELLSSPAAWLRKEGAWALSNVCAGSRVQIQAVLDCDALTPLMDLMRNDPGPARREAAWAIINAAAGGSSEQAELLVGHGAINALHDLLVGSVELVGLGLMGLEHILRQGDELFPDGSNLWAHSCVVAGVPAALMSIAAAHHPERFRAGVLLLRYW